MNFLKRIPNKSSGEIKIAVNHKIVRIKDIADFYGVVSVNIFREGLVDSRYRELSIRLNIVRVPA